MLILKSSETEVKFSKKVTNKVINKIQSWSNFSIFT